MNYTLEKIPENEHKADAPQDRLQLFFSTHDVTLTGWRLREFLRLFRESKIGAVRTANARYLNLRPEAPFVAAIAIEPVGKDSTNVLA